MSLSLQKRSVVELRKDVQAAITAKGLYGQQANVVIVIDRSGSMDELYRTGQVQMAADRTLALAAEFDDDGQVDVLAFHNRAFDCGKMSMTNHGTFIRDQIEQKISPAGTSYAPVMKNILARYGNPKASAGVFGIGASSGKAKLPTYVLFLTDGDNDDHEETQRVVLESRKHAIFWQFVGLGTAQFYFLKKLDNLQGPGLDNANFFPFDGSPITDEELYKKLLHEFPSWVKSARKDGLLA